MHLYLDTGRLCPTGLQREDLAFRQALSLRRAAFLQASFPGWPARDTKVGMAQCQAATMPCNPHAATTLLPTMGPFMRAGMKCEGLGTNSSTELQPSERGTDGQGSQGGHTRCIWVSTHHFKLSCVCHCSSLLACPPQRDRQTDRHPQHLPENH